MSRESPQAKRNAKILKRILDAHGQKNWGVYCTVSGGATGDRTSWLKSNGELARFATEEEAEDRAAECRAKNRTTHFSSVQFTYTPLPLTGENG